MKFLVSVVLALAVAGCTSTPIPTDQKAGQGTARSVSSSFNSAATTESNAKLTEGGGPASEGSTIPVFLKDGTVALDKEGKPIVITVGRGFRDLNVFFGEARISASSTISGTDTGTTQGVTATPTSTISPTTDVTIPVTPR